MIKARKAYLVIFLFFLSIVVFSQTNLVPNPSFETYTTCPNSTSQIEYASSWFNPTLHSPDYFNSCSSSATYSVSSNFFGNQNARTGNGYAGIGVACYNGSREYIEIKLLDSLSPSKNYYVEFFISLSDSSNYATDDIGIYLSKNKITANTIDSLGYVPQIKNASSNLLTDKVNWTKIQGVFTAPNYEKYLVVGNFNGYKGTDSVFVGSGGNISNPNYMGAYYYIDDITVIDASSIGINEYMFNPDKFFLYPNPCESFVFVNDFNQFHDFKLYDLMGNEVEFEVMKDKLDLKNIVSGIYFLSCKRNKEVYKCKILKK